MQLFSQSYSYSRGNRQLFARTSFRVLILGIVLCSLAVTAGLLLFQPAPVSAAQSIPYKMNFQGRLTNSAGNIVADGPYNMQFKLYDTSTAGTLLWSEIREVGNRVTVTNGLFSVQLGDFSALSPSLFSSATPRYFEVTMATPATATCSTAGCAVWESPMSPRQPLGASAYAMNSDTIDGIDGTSLTRLDVSNTFTGNSQIFRNATDSTSAFSVQNAASAAVLHVDTANGRIGIGTTAPVEKLDVRGLIAIGEAGAIDNDSSGIIMRGSSDDDFLYQGQYLNHYGYGFRNNANDSNGGASYVSGYFGIDLFAGGANRLALTRFGNVGIGVVQPQERLNLFQSSNIAVNLDIPGAPTVTPTGTVGTTSYTYTVTALDGAGGETVASAATTTTTGNATLSSSNSNAISWTAVTGANSYNVYRTASGGTPATTGKIGTVSTTTLNDTGLAAAGVSPTVTTAYVTKLSASGNSWLQGGNLGIGTAAPTSKLHVIGSTYLQGSAIVNNASGGVFVPSLGLISKTDGDINRLGIGVDSAYVGNIAVGRDGAAGSTAGYMALEVRNGVGAVNEAVRILSNGNVGIGTTIPGAKLQVAGDALFKNVTDSTTAFQVQNAAGTNLFAVDTVAGKLTVADTVVSAGKSLTITGGVTGTRPASPTEGMVYYDTTTKQLLTYANGKWQADRSTGTKIVAASNSSQAAKDAADYVADGNTATAGDGDQIQINAALTAAAGGKVYLLEGMYVIDASITVPNNTTLMGAGNGTLIELADLDATENMIENSDAVTGTGVIIRNLKLDGRSDLNTVGDQYGVYFNNMGGGSGSTARAGGKVDNVVAVRLVRAIYLNASAYSTVSNSSTQGNALQGLYLASSSNNTISDNVTQGNGSAGMWLNSSSNNTITGNTSKSNSTSGIILASSSYNAVSGNVLQSNSSYGIHMQTSSLDNVISGNNASNNGTTGISTNSSSDGNTITGNTSQGNNRGINIQTSYNTVSGNTATRNADAGIRLATATNNTISDNTLRDNGGATTNDGIVLQDADSNTFTGNTITDTSATTENNAIDFFDTLSDGNYFANNLLGTGLFNDIGTNSTYANQRDPNGVLMNKAAGGVAVQGPASAAAFTVKNVSGLALFTADTANNRVHVGSSTPDATAVVFVLDSYNGGSGDPTGTNGAMYYNDTLGKFRCHEGGAWKNCIGAVPVTSSVVRSADQTVTGTASTADNQIVIALEANSKYSLEALMIFGCSVSGSATYSWSSTGPSGSAITALSITGGGAITSSAGGTFNVPGVGAKLATSVEGYITTGATAGNLVLNYSLSSSSGDLIVHSGSRVKVEKLN